MAVEPGATAPSPRPTRSPTCSTCSSEGLDDRIAFTEIHNEVQVGHLTDGLTGDDRRRWSALRPRLERAVDAFHARHPDRRAPSTTPGVPVGAMRGIPENLDVLAVHPYVYGVLDALIAEYGLRGPVEEFDQEQGRRDLLRPDAPTLADWTVPAEPAGACDATIVGRRDLRARLGRRGGVRPLALRPLRRPTSRQMATKLRSGSTWPGTGLREHGVPLVFGEGWVGYTPRDGRFEEGPVGAEFCRLAVASPPASQAWGTIVCSNAAPQHAMWSDLALQQNATPLSRSAERHPARMTATSHPYVQRRTT